MMNWWKWEREFWRWAKTVQDRGEELANSLSDWEYGPKLPPIQGCDPPPDPYMSRAVLITIM